MYVIDLGDRIARLGDQSDMVMSGPAESGMGLFGLVVEVGGG